jgi:hypothetical protein
MFEVEPVKVYHSDRFVAEQRARAKALQEGALQAARKTAATWMAVAKTVMPMDTGRLWNSFAMAANSLSLAGGPFEVKALRPSRFWRSRYGALARQVRRIERFMQMYEREGRTNERYYTKLKNLRERAEQELQKLGGSKTAIMMINKGRNLEYTVRTQVYGGRGTSSVENGRARVQLISLEPHARTANKLTRYMQRIDNVVRTMEKYNTWPLTKAILYGNRAGGKP